MKKIFISAICVCLFFGMSISAFASTSKLNFLQGGVKYIYSNNPESVNGTMVGTKGKYTIHQSLQKNITYVSEFYHHNWSGGELRFGIAIKNNNNTKASVRVLNKAINSGNYTLETSTTTLKNYGNSTNDQYISVPANGTVIILSDDVPGSYIVNGKVKFIPTADNMAARVFFMKTTISTDSIFGLSRATSTNSTMTTGFFNYDTRYSNVDASVTPSFYLSAYTDNTNEYETGTNVLGSSKLLGNYGIIYDLQLKNASGKRIKITPNLDSPNATQSQIVLWTSSNNWYRTTYLSDNSDTKYWLMSVPSDQHIKFSLPGGNFGNVKFEIID